MPDPTSPSPVIGYFAREISSSLPAPDKERLAGYDEAIGKTTHHGDARRAWHCAGWAIQIAERDSNSHHQHFVEHLKESHQLWKDTIFGAGFGIMKKDGVGPGEDVEIQWVDAAVAVAKAEAEAERSGWDSVPWEDLLEEMLAVAPPAP